MATPTHGISAERHKIMKRIESYVWNYVRAAQNHDYDASSPVWSSIADSFTADPNTGDAAEETRTKAEFLASRARTYAKHPSYTFRILEITTMLNAQCDKAQVFVKYEVSGVPEGIVQQIAGLLDFKPVTETEGEKEWKCVKFTSMRGLTGPVINPFD